MSRTLAFLSRPIVVAAFIAAGLLAVGMAAGFTGAPAADAAPLSQTASPTPAPAASGDPAGDLTTASVDLHAGYIMDPYLLPVVGKAEASASTVAQGCNGLIGSEPSVVVNWSGEAPRLTFFVYSDDDAVLAIQAPDGSFICNDDAGARTVDPLIVFPKPAPGTYKVHVGSARPNQPALGFLGVSQASMDDAALSELDLSPMLRRRTRPVAQSLPQLDPRMLLTGRSPIFGSADLKAGFKPAQVFAAGGGDIAAVRMEGQKLACAGFVNAVPSYTFNWSGSSQALRLFLEAAEDSALAVVTPQQADGSQAVLCNMNSAPGNLNPAIDIPAPVEGKYAVYVAATKPSEVVGGKLTITGDMKARPAVLAPASE